MSQLIKNRNVVTDSWNYINPEETHIPTQGNIIVPLILWQQHREELLKHTGQLGIQLLGENEPEDILADLEKFSLIAIHFPTFMDGRGYSLARILRDRYGFKGELRATGDVLRDQLFYLNRCGFDAFEISDNTSAENFIAGFDDFDATYQAATDNALPLYRRTRLT